MKALFTAAAYAALVASGDPAIIAYHEYQAAQASGDLAGAEVAAKKALAAVDKPNGDINQTAVFSFNLALTEMELNQKAEAIAPARRALALARDGAKGVDPLAARLLLGEAELSTVPSADPSDLLAALRGASRRSDLDAYAYPAAIILGQTALDRHRYPDAQAAFEAAARHAAGAGGELDLVQGRALFQEGFALMLDHNDIVADRVLLEAIKQLARVAPEARDDKVSFGELSFAEADALLAAERTRQRSEDREVRFDPIQPSRQGLQGQPPRCSGRFVANQMPRYPTDLQSEFPAGAATMRAKISVGGDVSNVRVLAIFPEGPFRRTLEDPRVHWTYIADAAAPKGCRLEAVDADFDVVFPLR